ncbi:PxKF domain-containing protein [Pseudarthrobacter sp. MDT3-26]|uniref:PxKF domain-containing protein n=1 Tax=Pseudarthrobacter raffinosi TaxID=2953651 RepID=UPI00208FB1A9|nr:PxKF domain-containing protein [Pseudarthrobacter sp. MDT3-26]MCO4263942.1 PxKF domain-containing protein [Pseudarthrobacter sp. MDT3-26]
MKAGAAAPIKLGVGGNRGLDILAAGAPSSSAIACPGGTAPDEVEQTVAAGGSSLSYAAGSDTYTYVWKTQKDWAGTCRQFTLGLNDGTTHTALFDFRK